MWHANLKPQVMNVRLNESQDTTKAPMKTLMAILMLGGVLSVAPAGVVWAGPFDGAVFSVQYQGGHRGPGGPGGPGGFDKRQFREANNLQPPQQPGHPPRGQLTPDERRQLHRDLDKANRELYSGNRRKTVPAD